MIDINKKQVMPMQRKTFFLYTKSGFFGLSPFLLTQLAL